MYNELVEAFIEGGFSENTAHRLAEFINDAGWESVRDVLNNLQSE